LERKTTEPSRRFVSDSWVSCYPRHATPKRGLHCRKVAGCRSHAGIVSKRLNLS